MTGPSPRSADWTRDECVIAWDACPKDRQRYSARNPIVVEVSDLLGRSTGAVDYKFANLWAAHSGKTRGFTHLGRTAQDVVDEYRGRYGALHDAASAARDRLMEAGGSIRAEFQLAADIETPEVWSLRAWPDPHELDVRGSQIPNRASERIAFDLARAPLGPNDIVRYRRRGSGFEGFIVPAVAFFSNPYVFSVAASVAVAVGGLVGSQIKESVAWRLARRSDTKGMLRVLLANTLPDFHPGELSSTADLNALVVRLAAGGVHKISLTGPARARASALGVSSLRKELHRFFHIATNHLCPDCLAILSEVHRKLVADAA